MPKNRFTTLFFMLAAPRDTEIGEMVANASSIAVIDENKDLVVCALRDFRKQHDDYEVTGDGKDYSVTVSPKFFYALRNDDEEVHYAIFERALKLGMVAGNAETFRIGEEILKQLDLPDHDLPADDGRSL
jgi:hypothetical protein